MAATHAVGVAERHKPPRHVSASYRVRARHRWLLLAAAALVLGAVASTGASLWMQGYHLYVVHTGSMTPTYRPGDLIVDRPDHAPVRPGEVITFRHSDLTTDVVTHRVVDVTAAGEVHTKGDANATPDAWTIRPGQVQGRVAFGVPWLGFLAVYLQQPAGVGSVATMAASVMLLWGLFFGSEHRPLVA
jgi:signal peptidase